jgi:single-strand DNA-binding protein
MSGFRLPEINRVQLGGRLTRDPDKRYAGDGTPVTTFTLAFHRHWRGKDGARAEQTGFVPVVAAQRLAEVCAAHLRKGSAVVVEGRMQTREWTAPGGEKRSRLEVRADMVHFLDWPESGQAPEGALPPG